MQFGTPPDENFDFDIDNQFEYDDNPYDIQQPYLPPSLQPQVQQSEQKIQSNQCGPEQEGPAIEASKIPQSQKEPDFGPPSFGNFGSGP